MYYSCCTYSSQLQLTFLPAHNLPLPSMLFTLQYDTKEEFCSALLTSPIETLIRNPANNYWCNYPELSSHAHLHVQVAWPFPMKWMKTLARRRKELCVYVGVSWCARNTLNRTNTLWYLFVHSTFSSQQSLKNHLCKLLKFSNNLIVLPSKAVFKAEV